MAVFFVPILHEDAHAVEEDGMATVFGYLVTNPELYGAAEFNAAGKCMSIEKKPPMPQSNYIVTGLYFYSNTEVEVAKSIKSSARCESEITTVNHISFLMGF